VNLVHERKEGISLGNTYQNTSLPPSLYAHLLPLANNVVNIHSLSNSTFLAVTRDGCLKGFNLPSSRYCYNYQLYALSLHYRFLASHQSNSSGSQKKLKSQLETLSEIAEKQSRLQKRQHASSDFKIPC
jgi:hypothetical protein